MLNKRNEEFCKVNIVIKGMLVVLVSLIISLNFVLGDFSDTTVAKAATKVNTSKYDNVEYYKIVDSHYDIRDYSSGFPACHGILYVDLIDFDHNGTYELYLVYKNYDYDEYENYGGGYNATQEVWGMKGNKAVLLYSNDYCYAGRGGARSVSVTKGNSKTYLRYYQAYTGGMGNAPYQDIREETTSYWTLKNGKFVEVAEAYCFEEFADEDSGKKDRITYKCTENGKTTKTTKAKYKNFYKAYELKGRVNILNYDIDSVSLAINYKALTPTEKYLNNADKYFNDKTFSATNSSSKNGVTTITGNYVEHLCITYNNYLKLKAKKGAIITVSGNKLKLLDNYTLYNITTEEDYPFNKPTKNNPCYVDAYEGYPIYVKTKSYVKIKVNSTFPVDTCFDGSKSVKVFLNSNSYSHLIDVTFHKGNVVRLKEIYMP